MGHRTIETHTYYDDLTGDVVDSQDDLTEIRFSYAGDNYKIEVSAESLEKFDAAIAPFIDKATRAMAARSRPSKAKPTDYTKDQRATIRAWGNANGFTSGKGVLPRALIDAYVKAHS